MKTHPIRSTNPQRIAFINKEVRHLEIDETPGLDYLCLRPDPDAIRLGLHVYGLYQDEDKGKTFAIVANLSTTVQTLMPDTPLCDVIYVEDAGAKRGPGRPKKQEQAA